MCGIAGMVRPHGTVSEAELLAMGEAIVHRGPDAGGTWISRDGHAGFAHRRLAILDLDPRANQPMVSREGSYTICFNGEIYNYSSLRSRLLSEGVVFRTEGDTEVLLEAWNLWGRDKTLSAIEGMYAFAIHETATGKVTLVRDRAGEKPLVYGTVNGACVFASDLRSFDTLPGFPRPLNHEAIGLYFKFQCVPAPLTVYQGISKVPPGHWVEVVNGVPSQAQPYWRYPAESSPAEKVDLEEILTQEVRRQMGADVPLGAFLSGGIDSSLIVALMQKQTSKKIKTFTVGFEDPGYDESSHARAVAAHLGTDHHEIRLTAKQLQDAVPTVFKAFDEPFADVSSVPASLIASYARQSVKVALTGDGGDELFAGYNRHQMAARLMKFLALPAGARSMAAKGFSAVNQPVVTRLLSGVWTQPGTKLSKLEKLFRSEGVDSYYDNLRTTWPADMLVHKSGANHLSAGNLEAIFQQDFNHYLPNDVLTNMDRVCMAVGLESRAPLLGRNVIEASRRFSVSQKMHHGKGKWPLREILYRHVPRPLVERPKSGFSVPIGGWLRGELKDWAFDTLQSMNDDIIDKSKVLAAWDRHQKGEEMTSRIWSVLCWQSWYLSRAHAKE